MIDLRRITSPRVPETEAIVRNILKSMQEDWHATDELRQHRKLGSEADREAASLYLSDRYGKGLDPERVFLANGTWNVLLLLAAALAERGATILVETSTYMQIREVAEFLGLNLIGVELDEDGLRADAFEGACRRHQPKLLYCIPTAQNPTASIMPLERRKEIAEIARRYGVAIIADEAQGLIPVDAPLSFSIIAPDITWTVMGLSKCFLVGLRLAYVIAPDRAALADVMQRFGGMAMWYTSTMSATLAARAITDGSAAILLGRIQWEATRRRALASELLPSAALVGSGSLHLWLKDGNRSGDTLAALARENGVLVRSGSEFCLEAADGAPGIRVSLADVSYEELGEALVRISKIL